MAVYGGPEVVTDGLVLCLDAGNSRSYPGSGTAWTDLSGMGNVGTLTNGPTYSSANGGGIVFDGTNDYVSFSSNPPAPSFITFEVWCDIDSSNVVSPYVIFWLGGRDGTYRLAGTSNRFDWICRTSDNSWYSAGTVISATGLTVSSGTKYQVVGTYDGSYLRIHVNGVLKGTGSSISGTLPNANSFELGRAVNSGNVAPTKGSVYGVRIYNRALSAEEIAQNYAATRGRFGL
jgi:hypothetical protein